MDIAVDSVQIQFTMPDAVQVPGLLIQLDQILIYLSASADPSITPGVFITPLRTSMSAHSPTLSLGPRPVAATAVAQLPADATTVRSARPAFTVLITRGPTGTDTTLRARVQIATTTDFSDPVTFSAVATDIFGRVPTLLNTPVDLSDGVHYWRVAVANAAISSAWSAYRTLTVDTTIGAASLTLTVEVRAGVTGAPQLWFTRPASATPGQAVTAYGVGLAGDPTITLSPATGEPLNPVATTVSTIAATAHAYTSDRRIEPSGAVDPRHDEVTFTMPSVPVPGAPLRIGSDVS